MPERSLVKNASDRKQVATARETEKMRLERDQSDLVELMKLPAFRRFSWRFLTRCGTYESIFETSAKIYYNAGQQDVGHWWLAQLAQASPDGYRLMQEEQARRAAAEQPTHRPTPDEDDES